MPPFSPHAYTAWLWDQVTTLRFLSRLTRVKPRTLHEILQWRDSRPKVFECMVLGKAFGLERA